MRNATHAIIIAAGFVGLIGPALAIDMTAAELKAFISDRTLYLETTAASNSGHAGHGVIYWGKDGTALEQTPSGVIWHGTWRIEGDKLCPSWKEKPGTGCILYDKTGDTVSIVAADGKVRAKVVKTAASNAEHLTP